MKLNENTLELVVMDWFGEIGYETRHATELEKERENFSQVTLNGRLRDALRRINPQMADDILDDAFRKLAVPNSPSLIVNNHTQHRHFIEGVPVEYMRTDGTIGGDLVRVFDFENPENNEFLVVNQFTVTDNKYVRRADVVVFVNGLPLAVLELKNPISDTATILAAYNQLQTYKNEIPALFHHNAALVVSDGLTTRIGTLTANFERFMPWREDAHREPRTLCEGAREQSSRLSECEMLVRSLFDKRRLLDLLRYFIVFEDDGGGNLVKKMAGYHQYHAVNLAIKATLAASKNSGDKRCGVIWHTQGSGKSLTMAFYAGRVILEPKMKNPTLVVITDRNDLDDQLFSTFSRCKELLRQEPQQAASREHLCKILKTDAGGVIFTTVQKFAQTGEHLSDRRNIIVIADEAHRSQYDFIDGFARNLRAALPNASFIGFTGTPIELKDKNTRAVFGDYISIYDIEQAVQDGATVPIYYESRLAKLKLNDDLCPHLDEDFEEATEGEESQHREKLKSRWAQLEALVGTENRVAQIAEDIVRHFERRCEALDGKAMIVCMSRRICVDLYNAIVKIRLDWQSDDDNAGVIKIVMTGSASDPADWQQHIRSKQRREELAKNFKDPKSPMQIVIVRDMWLTGFDAPCLHTMYVDKPMRGHGLMQAIARVNRVFKDKPGGLVVDYLGLADQLKEALSTYIESGGKGQTAINQEDAVAALVECYEICRSMFHGFDYSAWKNDATNKEPRTQFAGKKQCEGALAQSARLSILPAAQEHILAQKDGKSRFSKAVAELSQAFALAVPHDDALKLRDEVAFFQAMGRVLAKSGITSDTGKSSDTIDFAIRQLVSSAVSSGEVIDVFSAAGLEKPDISILSEDFLSEVRNMPHRNLAIELLRKLLAGEIKTKCRKNVVQERRFSEMLAEAIRKYQNRLLTSAEILEELFGLAREMREAHFRGEQTGLTEDEIAFYDALGVNDSAVAMLGDDTLRQIAKELEQSVKRSVTIDWTIRESARAQIRVIVKRILRKYGYPPDKQEQAVNLVMEQAAIICKDYAENEI